MKATKNGAAELRDRDGDEEGGRQTEAEFEAVAERREPPPERTSFLI